MSLLPGTKATKDTGERRGRAAGRSEKQDDHSEGLSARVGVVFIQISKCSPVYAVFTSVNGQKKAEEGINLERTYRHHFQ